jgi:hypothetical protein
VVPVTRLPDDVAIALAALEREHGSAKVVPPGPRRDAIAERIGCSGDATVAIVERDGLGGTAVAVSPSGLVSEPIMWKP